MGELTFQWNFGDGATATGKQTSHRFDATDEPRTVTLSASDGQATTTQTLTLRPPPPVCDPNVLPGILAVEGSESLELGAVPLGQTATRTFLVRNRDPGPSSQIKLRIDVAGAGFSADPTEVILDAGASMPIRVLVQLFGITMGVNGGSGAAAACAPSKAAAYCASTSTPGNPAGRKMVTSCLRPVAGHACRPVTSTSAPLTHRSLTALSAKHSRNLPTL